MARNRVSVDRDIIPAFVRTGKQTKSEGRFAVSFLIVVGDAVIMNSKPGSCFFSKRFRWAASVKAIIFPEFAGVPSNCCTKSVISIFSLAKERCNLESWATSTGDTLNRKKFYFSSRLRAPVIALTFLHFDRRWENFMNYIWQTFPDHCADLIHPWLNWNTRTKCVLIGLVKERLSFITGTWSFMEVRRATLELTMTCICWIWVRNFG